MTRETKTVTVLRIASGLAMLLVSFCFLEVLYVLISTHPNADFSSILYVLAIFLPFGLGCLFLAWRLLRDGFSSDRATLFPKWFFWAFGIFISILVGIAGYFHPVSIIPVIVAVLFTVITYKYRKK